MILKIIKRIASELYFGQRTAQHFILSLMSRSRTYLGVMDICPVLSGTLLSEMKRRSHTLGLCKQQWFLPQNNSSQPLIK